MEKLNALSEKISQILVKLYNFLLGWLYFTDNDCYKKLYHLSFFPTLLNSLKLDNNNNVYYHHKYKHQLIYFEKISNCFILVFSH